MLLVMVYVSHARLDLDTDLVKFDPQLPMHQVSSLHDIDVVYAYLSIATEVTRTRLEATFNLPKNQQLVGFNSQLILYQDWSFYQG